MPCTCPQCQPHTIVARFLRRWRIEAAFQTVRIHLGGETQHQGADPAIALNHPALPGLCSWVALTAHVLLQGRHVQPRRTTLEPYAPMVTDSPALVQTTLRTGEPHCARSRPYLNMSKPLPRFPERLRDIRHGTARTQPQPGCGLDPRSPGLPPVLDGQDRIVQSPAKAATRVGSRRFPTCYLRTVNSVTINVPVVTAVVFK